MFIYGRKLINGSVEWLVVPAPFCDTGVAWTEISWFPIHIGGTDMATNVGLWQLALDLVLEEEVSLGVARSLSVLITFRVGQKCVRKGAPRLRHSPVVELSGTGSNSLAQPPL